MGDRSSSWTPILVPSLAVGAPVILVSLLRYRELTWEFFFFTSLVVIGDLLRLRLSFGTVSLSSVPLFAAVMLFGYSFCVVCAAVSSLVDGLVHRKSWERIALNVTHMALAVAISWLFFHVLGGEQVTLLSLPGLLVSLATWGVYFCVNVGLVTAAFHVVEGKPWFDSWRTLLAPVLPVSPMAGVIAVTLAAAYQTSGMLTLVLFLGIYVVAYGALLSSALRVENQLLTTRYEDTQANLRDLVAGMLNGVVAVDSSRRVTMMNRAAEELFGRRAGGAVGRDVAEIGEPNLPALLDHALSTGVGIPGRELHLSAAGRQLEAFCSVSVLRDAAGRPSGAVAVFQDITEQKEIERRLGHLDRLALMGEFAAGVVHEINNPLALVSMALSNVRSGLEAGETGEAVRDLDLARRNLGRLEKLSRQLLSFSRPVPAEARPVDVGETLGGVLNIVAPQARIARVRVTREIPGGLELLAESSALEQVFLNLAANAVQAMPGGGVLHVSAGRTAARLSDVVEGRAPGGDGPPPFGRRAVRVLGPVRAEPAGRKRGFVWVRFTDTGVGMSPQALQRLGQSFFTTKEQGTGLGVAIVSKILAQYRGVMEVWSEEGVGTSFRLWFPELTAAELAEAGEVFPDTTSSYRELQAAEGEAAAGLAGVARETAGLSWARWTGLSADLPGHGGDEGEDSSE